MSVALSDAGGTLPAPVLTLLDACSRGTGAAVRLWRRREEEWQALYPGEDAPPPREADLVLVERGPEPLYLELGEAPREGEASPDRAFLVDAVTRIIAYEREARLAARELAERYEEINLLYSISETLGSVVSLEAAAGRILAEVADLLGARRASLWVYHADDGRLHLTASVGDEGVSGPIAAADPDSIAAKVFRERQPVNLEQGVSLPRGSAREPRPSEREAFLSVPIQFTPPEGVSRTVGVITLIGRTSNVRFSAGDVRLLAAIASQIGAALETHRLMEESVRQERLLRELELAHDLQMKLLPDVSRFQGTAHVAARCVPADSVGGDFYHLFRLSHERLGVMIGDVSSHGFSAALIMALTLSAVAIYAKESDPPAEVLQRVHQALIGELESTEMYMTLFYGVLDPGAGRITYASAGHPHAFRIRGDGGAERLAATSPPLGVLPLAEYHERTVEWAPAEDLLCLFTDGLSDAFSAAGGVSGEAKLVAAVREMHERSPADILERLFALAAAASSSAIPPDDRTAVLVRS